MKQKVDMVIYGEPSNDGVLIEEMEEWCTSKGYTIKRGVQYNVVDAPDYTGADGTLKKGREDLHYTHEIIDGKAVSKDDNPVYDNP